MAAMVRRATSPCKLLGWQFVRVMQITPRAWVTSVRLDAAMRALEEGDDSVAAIAQACGFADQSAFARTFASTWG